MTREEILENAKPILFNTDMVRAILDGRKTVTRRVMKPQPWKIGEGEYECRHEKGFYDMGGNNWACRQCGCGVIPMKGGSYFHARYQPGDLLYVRETWGVMRAKRYDAIVDIAYKAGGQNKTIYFPYGGTDSINRDSYDEFVRKWSNKSYLSWHPSIHMPKEAARIFLRVTDVRVEILQDIDDDGIVAEGLEIGCDFDELWNSTLKKSDLVRYGWDANPWVWVIEFERGMADE